MLIRKLWKFGGNLLFSIMKCDFLKEYFGGSAAEFKLFDDTCLMNPCLHWWEGIKRRLNI